ncbi:putative S-layer protein [Candidatus Woesearchaeota archaeon]|nr:putative S-layer protein [Candidatus Woesearchaeota archaeon]
MKGKAIFASLMLLLVAIFAMASVSAQIVIDEVEFDDDEVSPSSSTEITNFERPQDGVEVKVHFTYEDNADGVSDSMDEVEVEVELTGYDDSNDRVRDTEYVDEVKEGETYVERLTLDFPWDMTQDYYTLRVYICPRSGDCVEETYELDIEAVEHGFAIKDVDFSPGLTVEAGRALLTTVRVENFGDEEDNEGVKVKVSIPELGLSASDYLDEVDEDDSVSSEELYIRVPSGTAAGIYDVEVSVTYDDGDETVTEEYSLTVTAAEEATATEEAVESKTVITVGPEAQDMTAGQGGAVYPITLTNAAGEAKTYVVSVSGYDSWGSVRIDPSNVVVLGQGETQTVYLFVSADEEASGSYTFAVTVSAGSEALKQMLLTANVEGAPAAEETSSSDSVKKGLMVGLAVLAILLVILGLIVVVNKLRQDDEEDEKESKTYY